MRQLLALDRGQRLQIVWGGIGGEKLWDWLRGEDYGDAELEHQKSIGHSHVLPPELRTPEGAYAVANKLLHKSAMRLRKARLWASGDDRHPPLHCAQDGAPLPGTPREFIKNRGQRAAPSSNARIIRRCSRVCSVSGRQCPSGPAYEKPFFVGVSLRDLVPDRLHTLSLFSGLAEEQRRTQLTAAMDRINNKYGTNTLGFASMLLAGAAAPTRIAFSSIPELF